MHQANRRGCGLMPYIWPEISVSSLRNPALDILPGSLWIPHLINVIQGVAFTYEEGELIADDNAHEKYLPTKTAPSQSLRFVCKTSEGGWAHQIANLTRGYNISYIVFTHCLSYVDTSG